jgi:diaminopropionate ammonia-lyase
LIHLPPTDRSFDVSEMIRHRPAEGTLAFELVPNSLADRTAPYGEAESAVLNDAAFAAARAAISAWPGYAPTPLHALPGLAAEAGVGAIHYKDEGTRFGLGSFKALGGAYAVARLLSRKVAEIKSSEPTMEEILSGAHRDVVSGITVCCATDGNHGRSVAWGARTFGCNCVIFIHATVSEGRKQAIEKYGARVEQLDRAPTHVFVQTGVGGLAAAVAAQFKRRFGAERPWMVLADPARAACWVETVRRGEPTAVHGDLDTLMAGLACGEVSLLAWEVLKRHADAVIAVEDKDAVDMMRRLAEPQSGDPAIVAGESAVAGLVALFAVMREDAARAVLGLGPDSRVLVFGTEGDTDPELYRELVGLSGDRVRERAA